MCEGATRSFKLKKPMLLDERNTFCELNKILNKYQTMLPPVVINCFTGSRQEAIKYIGMGCYIGITGYIWKDQEDGIQALLRDDDLPLDKLLIKTEAPFMFPFVDKANFDDISKAISENAKEFAGGCSPGRNEPAIMLLVRTHCCLHKQTSRRSCPSEHYKFTQILQNTNEWQQWGMDPAKIRCVIGLR